MTPPNQTGRRVSLGIPGDSGAWIVDRLYGRLCGHILAWSERKQVAYICPMDVLLLDIAETLQTTDVRLPNGDILFSNSDNRADNDVVEISGSEAWTEDDIPDTEDIYQSPHTTHHVGKDNVNMNILARDMDKVHIQETGVRYGMK